MNVLKRSINSIPKLPIHFTDSTFHFYWSSPPNFQQQVYLYHKISTSSIDLGIQVPNPKIDKNLASYIYYDRRNQDYPPILYKMAPNAAYLQRYLNDKTPTNYSFMTTVSPVFHKVHYKTSLDKSKRELLEMDNMTDMKKKLYINCITNCPYQGVLDLDFIVHEILFYHTNYNFHELCLDDTIGNMSFEDFKYIIDTICFFGVPKSKIGLRLKDGPAIRSILRYALRNHFTKFDVVCEKVYRSPSSLITDSFFEYL
jgi:hypothetical protein